MASTTFNIGHLHLHYHAAPAAAPAAASAPMDVEADVETAAKALLQLRNAVLLVQDPEDDHGRYFEASIAGSTKRSITIVWHGFELNGEPVYARMSTSDFGKRRVVLDSRLDLAKRKCEPVSYKIDGQQVGPTGIGYYIPGQ